VFKKGIDNSIIKYMDKQSKWLLKWVWLKVLVLAALFLSSLFIFAYIAHEAVYEQEDAFDSHVHTYLLAHTTPWLIEVARGFTFLGSSIFLFPAYILIVAVLIIFKKKRYALDISIVALSGFLVMQVLKRVFHRKRPDLPIIRNIHNYSFPSGHSLSAFIFCSILAYLVWQGKARAVYKWMLTVLLLLLAIAIGISRIVLNVHFATDVIAGFCLGIMWVMLSFWVIQKINHRRLLQ
jgi:undecaprenyl-diphosphatase